jgi:hypothetical protein
MCDGIPWSNYFDNYTVFASLQYARIVTPSARAKLRSPFQINVRQGASGREKSRRAYVPGGFWCAFLAALRDQSSRRR